MKFYISSLVLCINSVYTAIIIYNNTFVGARKQALLSFIIALFSRHNFVSYGGVIIALMFIFHSTDDTHSQRCVRAFYL